MYWSIHGSPVTAPDARAGDADATKAATVTRSNERILRPMRNPMMTEADGSVTERWRAPTAGTLRARVIGVAVALAAAALAAVGRRWGR